MKKENKSDICNSNAYNASNENTVSLLLFIDQATLAKSNIQSSFWGLYSAIAELPPIIRFCHHNIISHSFYAGRNPDFNRFFKEYNTSLNCLITNGLTINGLKFNIRVHAVVADAPARAKITYTTQYNGKYGCLHCIQAAEEISRNKRVFRYLENAQVRSSSLYKKQVKLVKENRNTQDSRGVRGSAYLSRWVQIPNGILLDYMHLSLEGTFTWMMKFWLEKTLSNLDK